MGRSAHVLGRSNVGKSRKIEDRPEDGRTPVMQRLQLFDKFAERLEIEDVRPSFA